MWYWKHRRQSQQGGTLRSPYPELFNLSKTSIHTRGSAHAVSTMTWQCSYTLFQSLCQIFGKYWAADVGSSTLQSRSSSMWLCIVSACEDYLKGRYFSNKEDLLRVWDNECTELPKETWKSWLDDWFWRMHKCIDCRAKYYFERMWKLILFCKTFLVIFVFHLWYQGDEPRRPLSVVKFSGLFGSSHWCWLYAFLMLFECDLSDQLLLKWLGIYANTRLISLGALLYRSRILKGHVTWSRSNMSNRM